MRKIAISQPRYLPAANYIERMMMSDVFVILDNVQHQRRAYEHRNKIRTSDGSTWLSIPIDRKQSASDKIYDMRLLNNDWQEKHLKSFQLNYKKTPKYDEIMPMLERYYQLKWVYLSDAVKDMLDIILNYLDIQVETVWASKYNWTKTKDDLLIEITEKLNGTAYISGPNGRDYIDASKFKEASIQLLYHEYNHPKYEQIWGDFIPYMTIWDLMFYFGKETKSIICTGKLEE